MYHKTNKTIWLYIFITIICFNISEAIADHFSFSPPCTTTFMHFYGDVFTIDNEISEKGDEIAVFDQQGTICGHFVVTHPGFFNLVVYGDDITSPTDDGAAINEDLIFKIWDASKGIEICLDNSMFIQKEVFSTTQIETIPPKFVGNREFRGMGIAAFSEPIVDIHIAAWPKNVVEGSSTKITVWIGGTMVNEDRLLSMKVDPPDLFSSSSEWNVTIPANQNKIEFNVKTKNNYVLENNYSIDGSGTRSARISAHFVNNSDEVSIRIIDNEEDASDQLLYVNTSIPPIEADTFQKYDYWVKNTSGSDIYSTKSITLQITTLGYPKIDMYPDECTIHTIRTDDMESCATELRPEDEMPPGKYYLKIIGTQRGTTNRFLALETINIHNDRKPDYEIHNSSGRSLNLDPENVFTFRFIAENSNEGFGSLPFVVFYIEHEGIKNIIYNTYADVMYYGDQFVLEPVITLPSEPGIYRLWAEINTLTEYQLDEMNYSNNSSSKSTITIKDNRPIILTPIKDITVYENALQKFIDLKTVFAPNNESIITTVHSNDNPTLITPHIEGSMLVLDFNKNQSGTANIQILATAGNHSISDAFIVNVKEYDDIYQTNDIRITNNTGKQFTVSFVTPLNGSAYLMYGSDIVNQNNWIRVDDDRGNNVDDDIHHITVKDLSYETTYYFEVIFGSAKDDNDGAFYSVTTAPMLIPNSFETCEINGLIFSDETHTKVAENAIVYLHLIDDDEKQQSNKLSVMVTPEDEGSWKILLDNLRTFDLQSFYPFTCGDDSLSMEVQAGSDGTFRKNIFDDYETFENIALSKVHTISVVSSGNGSIEPSGVVYVDHGKNQSFTIEAAFCERIEDVVVDNISLGPVKDYTFTNVMFDHSIKVTFVTQEFDITTEAGSNGSISPSMPMLCGMTQPISIVPDTCYKVQDVLVDGKSVGAVAAYTFTNISKSQSISAIFSLKEYSIITASNGNGIISDSEKVTCGSNKTIQITPNACYEIGKLIVDGQKVALEDSYLFNNIISDHQIDVEFTQKTFGITSIAMDGGEISLSNPAIACGSNKTFTITTYPGYEINNIVVDGQDKGVLSEYTFENVDEAHEIVAHFGAVYHFQEGWNAFALRFQPDTPYNSKSLIQTINDADGQITKVWAWDKKCGCPKTYGINDAKAFEIEMGVGYFLLSETTSKWINVGKSLDHLSYNFSEGLTLSAFPFPANYKASTLATQLNSFAENIVVIYRRNGSEWVSHEIGTTFDDFNIDPVEAYFLQSANSFEFDLTKTIDF